jgi:hypothetical protein
MAIELGPEDLRHQAQNELVGLDHAYICRGISAGEVVIVLYMSSF